MSANIILKCLAIQLIFIACKQPPTVGNSPCSLNIELAMEEYDELLNDADPNNDPAVEPRDCVLPTPEPGAQLSYRAKLTDFNEEQESRMRDALERAKIVLNSAEFKEKVLSHTYNGEEVFVENNGQSNMEIYETIMAASETLLPEIDQEMDLDMTLYYKNNSTVGYTYPDTIQVWVNDKFFSTNTLGQVAANAVHEWTHKIGYGHSYYNSPERPYTVPYAIGSIIEEMVDSM